jgi:formate-dependent nitrite reductase cytochrome c552 subunit
MLIGTNGYEYPSYTYELTNHRSATEDGCLDCHMKHAENLRVGGHAFNMTYDDGTDVMVNNTACADCHGDLTTDFDGVQTRPTHRSGPSHPARGCGSGERVGRHRALVVTSSDSAGAVWNYLLAMEDRARVCTIASTSGIVKYLYGGYGGAG